MESQLQNPEFRNNPENFTHVVYTIKNTTDSDVGFHI